jgi:nucleotide-binding universal stress UspA family protein
MYKKILIPIAFDHKHSGKEAIEVAKLLQSGGAEIMLLHVIEQIPAYVSAQLPEGIMGDRKTDVVFQLRQIASDSDIVVKSHVVEGHSGATIVDFATEHGVDLIVIASHRPEFADYFLGSTAARVVRHAPCAVHVMR